MTLTASETTTMSVYWGPADPYATTSVPRHFPERANPLDSVGHGLSSAFSGLGHGFKEAGNLRTMLHPKIDTRESRTAYYVDVQLPGLEKTDKEHLNVHWISARTLLVKALIERPEVPGEAKGKAVGGTETPTRGGASTPKLGKVGEDVYLTVGERHVGVYGRALGFQVDVNHDKTTASLRAGILTLVVPKLEEEKRLDKKVEVTTAGKKSHDDVLVSTT